MKMIALFSGQHGGLVGSTVSSQEEGPGFDSTR